MRWCRHVQCQWAHSHFTQLIVKQLVGPRRLDDDGVAPERREDQSQYHRGSNSDVLLALADPPANTCVAASMSQRSNVQ